MPIKIPNTLVEELIRQGLMNKKDSKAYEDLARKEDKELGQILIEKDVVTSANLLQIKSQLYHLPIVKLEEVQIDNNALKEVSEDIVAFYKIAPFAREGNVLKVGVLNPEDIDALEALKFIASGRGFTIDKYVMDYKDFESVLRGYRSLSAEVGKALESLSDEIEEEAVGPQKIEEITAEGAVTKIVASIVKYAVESRASDIHIEPFEEKVNVRFRVDGVLIIALTLPKNVHSAVLTRIKVLSNLKIDETRLAQDGRFSTTLNKRRIDFRVSTFPTKNGEKVVMRILDPLTSKIDLVDLGLEGRSMEVLERSLAKPFGSVLITGPTGSGKSTTLAGILKRMNNEEVNIVTLEDPIEYFVEGVNQSQVHEEIGYTFASGLRHILRQDPDIIMVGEIRDPETASLAVQAALTGHIVISTLHTNDAIGVVPRLIDMKVEKYLIPPTLNVAVAQRLLRRLCSDCKIKDKANVAEEGIINAALQTMPEQYSKQLYSATGYEIYRPNIDNACKKCGGKAFKGRIAIFEMLEMNDHLEKIILADISEASLREEGKRQGMITMFQDGILKTLKGVCSLDELLEVAQMEDKG